MKVKFMPSGEEHEIEFNETILHLAQRKDIHIQSVCKGLPSCAECKVNIIEGEHHVLPPSSKEVALIGTAHYVDLSRLSCQLRCFGDVTVDLAEQINKQARMSSKARDRGRKDGKESQAVLGSIVDESATFDDDLEDASRSNNRNRPKKQKSIDNKAAFYGGFLEGEEEKKKSGSGRSRNRNNKKSGKKKQQASGGGQSQSKQGGSPQSTSPQGEGATKKKRSRRRRRKPTDKPKADA